MATPSAAHPWDGGGGHQDDLVGGADGFGQPAVGGQQLAGLPADVEDGQLGLVLRLGGQRDLVDAGEDLAGALEQDVVALALPPVGRVQAELGGARRGESGGGDRAALDDSDRGGCRQAGGQGDGARADRAGGPDHGDGVLAVGR